MTFLDKISEGLGGVSLGGAYLFIKTNSNPQIWDEIIHSAFAIGTAVIIAILSTVVIHYVKKLLK